MYAEWIQNESLIALIAEAMEKTLKSPQPEHIDNMFSYYIGRHLDRLYQANFDDARKASLEWGYLPLFQFEDRELKILHRALATDPSFFVEIISLVYRGEHEEPRQLTDSEQARTITARELLESWKIVPGTQKDGSIDADWLNTWVREARTLLEKADRKEIGDDRIGKLLRYGPEPVGDEWPAKAIRDIIEESSSIELEEGFRVEVYNSRGVTTRGPIDGGQQERDLAAKYRRYALHSSTLWPRTAALLNAISKSYERDAIRHDLDADLTEDFW